MKTKLLRKLRKKYHFRITYRGANGWTTIAYCEKKDMVLHVVNNKKHLAFDEFMTEIGYHFLANERRKRIIERKLVIMGKEVFNNG